MNVGMTSIPGRCERSVSGGDYICTRPEGHDGMHANERKGIVFAAWPDRDAEDDCCAHGETYSFLGDHLHRCEVCGTVLRRIDIADDEPGVWLTDLTVRPNTTRKVRYEVVSP